MFPNVTNRDAVALGLAGSAKNYAFAIGSGGGTPTTSSTSTSLTSDYESMKTSSSRRSKAVVEIAKTNAKAPRYPSSLIVPAPAANLFRGYHMSHSFNSLSATGVPKQFSPSFSVWGIRRFQNMSLAKTTTQSSPGPSITARGCQFPIPGAAQSLVGPCPRGLTLDVQRTLRRRTLLEPPRPLTGQLQPGIGGARVLGGTSISRDYSGTSIHYRRPVPVPFSYIPIPTPSCNLDISGAYQLAPPAGPIGPPFTAIIKTSDLCTYCFGFGGWMGSMNLSPATGFVRGLIPNSSELPPTLIPFTGQVNGSEISITSKWFDGTLIKMEGPQPSSPLVLDEPFKPPDGVDNPCGGFTEVSNISIEASGSRTSLFTSSLGDIKLVGGMVEGSYGGYSSEREEVWSYDPNTTSLYLTCCSSSTTVPFYFPAPPPILDLQVWFNLLKPGEQGYNQEYKPSFTWSFGTENLGTPERSDTLNRYLNFYLSEETGVTPAGEPTWRQLIQLTHQPIETSTPVGFLLNPFPFLPVYGTYLIEVQEVVHVDGFPEINTANYLVFAGDPYPAPPPPTVVPPGPPIDLVGQGGQELVLLTWDPPTDTGGSIVTSYTVEQAPDNGAGVPGLYQEIVSDLTDLDYIVDPLEPSTVYWFRVSATNSAGTGDPTIGISVETGPNLPGPPSQPLDLKGVPGLNVVQLTWEPPAYNGGKVVNSYTLQKSDIDSPYSWSDVFVGNALTDTVTGLTSALKYWFKVQATNSEGNGPFTFPLEVTTGGIPPSPPTAPPVLVATGGTREVTLDWQAPIGDGGSPILAYQIEQAPDVAGAPGVWVVLPDLVNGQTLNTIITGLAISTTYWFRVSAQNTEVGLGPPSPEESAETNAAAATVPSAPRSVTARGGIKEVTVNWVAPASTGGDPLTSYELQRSDDGDDPVPTWVLLAPPVVAPASTLTDTGLVDDKKYWYQVRATNLIGDSDWSSSADATTLKQPVDPDPPTNLVAKAGVDQVALTWDAPAYNGGALLKDYQVQYSTTAPGAPPWTDAPPPLPTTTSSIVTGLTALTQYWFHVSATNNASKTSVFSSPPATATPIPTGAVPGPPIDLVATPGAKKIQLSWKPPLNDGGQPVTSYNLEMSKIPSPYSWSDIAVGLTDLTYIEVGLDDDTTYWFRASAHNVLGDGPFSNIASAKTLVPGGDCDPSCSGGVTKWNGSTQDSIPINGTSKHEHGIGAQVYWSATGMEYGVPGTAKPPGPGCVSKWDLSLLSADGKTLIATWAGEDITWPRSFHVMKTNDALPKPLPSTFVVSQLDEKTDYVLHLTPVRDAGGGGCTKPPILPIPIKTGCYVTPPPIDKCDASCQGTKVQWDGTLGTSTQINGTDHSKPNDVAAEIHWSTDNMTFGLPAAQGGPGCVDYWNLSVSTTATPPVVIGTNDTALLGVGNIVIANFAYPPSEAAPAWVWEISSLKPDATYKWTATPKRSSVMPGCPTPPSISTTFKMGNPATPKPPPGPPVPPLPDTGNLPQVYVTTYGIPSWGQTTMKTMMGQQFFSAGKALTQGKNQDKMTVPYQQQQNWAMVRAWAKNFFHQYAGFIAQNEEVVNAMILIGDWATLFPAAGLPVQTSNLGEPGTPTYGQVAGSQVNWSLEDGIYGYCSPNGPVDFGLSYNADNAAAPPPAGLGEWWADDPDQMGCPLILDFFIPLAQLMKSQKRVIEISVNGDVSKNGNAASYHSLDAGNYTAADRRRSAWVRSVAPLDLIVSAVTPSGFQEWTPATSSTVPGLWGPLTTPTPTNKTQEVSFKISTAAYNTLISSSGAPNKPMSQNNGSAAAAPLSASGQIVSSTHNGSVATFKVAIPMAGAPASGKREDGAFTITDPDPAAKYNANATLYFGPVTDPTNPTPAGGYPVTSTNISVGIFLKNWVIQQSSSTGTFPTTNAALDPGTPNTGGIIGQMDSTSGPAAGKAPLGFGAIEISMALEHGLTEADVKVYLKSAPATSPPVYETAFTHRVYQVPASWAVGDPIPPPSPPYYSIKIAGIGVAKSVLTPTTFNYTTLAMQASANPDHVSSVTARALGPANTAASNGGWLPDSWNAAKGDANFPPHWNVSLDQNQLPELEDPDANVINAFGDPGVLIMGGGNVFIGTGVGAFTGRASYFDEESVPNSTTRPELVTISGTGTGENGTYYCPTTPISLINKEVGFPLDNLHQLYILIYRINQKVMKFNWTYSTANPAHDKTSPYFGLVVPLISHVHHDKESYQVNKDPVYPETDPTTGDILTSWLMLGKSSADIDAMSWAEFLVWKQSRRQTSVAYEKYLFNRYMPAQYLPDWRQGGTSSTHVHYMPLNTGCQIPNTGKTDTTGTKPYGRTGGELLWDTTSKPWNKNQGRNFGLDADPNASRTSKTITGKGIGNYSNDFNDRRLGDTLDGIQRYQMGWVNYTVTSWAYSGFSPGQEITFKIDSPTGGISLGQLCWQATSGATGEVKSISAASFVITTFQGKWTPTGVITVFDTGPPPALLTQVITGISEPQKQKYTSQGTNESYAELYNIGEVKPPVGQLWLYDDSTVDANKKPVVPSPNLTLSVDPSGYAGGLVTGAGALTADIDSIYNTSSIVLKNLKKAGVSVDFPNMFSVNEHVILTKAGGVEPLNAVVKCIYKPTAAAPFPAEFSEMLDPASSNEYGKGVYALPAAASDSMIPNELGSACIPGNKTPACPAGVSVICPDVAPKVTVGPYYKLNCVTNSLIGRIFSKYNTKDPGGSGADWPFLGANAVNVGSNIKSPALTDLWQRFDAINTGVIPLDGRGFKAATTPGGTGVAEPSSGCDGTYAPFSSPWVAVDGKMDLSSLYADGSMNNGAEIIQGSSASFKIPVGPRQAIALFANEYIGGALTVDPAIRPGATGSGWAPVVKGASCYKCPPAEYLPGTNTGTNGWIGSRGMEVYVYHQLVSDSMNAAFLSVKDLSPDPPFNQADWELSIKSTGTAASDFDEIGFSDAANGWGGEYNGLSALQGPGTTGFSHMKDFLKSCGSMMTGADAIGKSRVGLYTVGFLPSTWWTKAGVTNNYGQ